MIKIELANTEVVRKELAKKIANDNKRRQAEYVDILLKLQAEIRKDTPVNIARLKNGTQVDRKELRVFNSVKYAPFVEWGTKKRAKVPTELSEYASRFRGQKGDGTTKLITAIEQWVKRKGLAATYSIKTQKRTKSKGEAQRQRTLAYFIARKIRKEGIKPQPFFFHDKNGNSRMKRLAELVNKVK